MRQVDAAERRARLAIRHRLAAGARASTPEEVAHSLVALHSSDPATVFISAWARMTEPSLAAVERALYGDRTLIRMHGMRRTLWVVERDLAPAIQHAAADAIAFTERRRLLGMIRDAGVADDPDAWLSRAEAEALDALEELGEATTAELARAVPRLAERTTLARGKRYEVEIALGSRVLLLLGLEGRAVRGRPLGTWAASQYRWSPASTVHPDGLPEGSARASRGEIVGRWLASFGPGTEADLRWWGGWSVREVRAALEDVEAEAVGLEDGSLAYVLPDDLEPAEDAAPWAALVPALDPTTMGWRERSWYLGPHAERLFDTNGNAGPAIWLDGRVVGGWSQRSDGSVVLGILEDVGAEGRARIEAEAGRLEPLLGGRRVIPRFRTPLERDLSA